MQQAEELGDFIYVPPTEDKEEEEEFTDAAQVSGGDGWGGGGTGCLCWDIFVLPCGTFGGAKSRFPPKMDLLPCCKIWRNRVLCF